MDIPCSALAHLQALFTICRCPHVSDCEVLSRLSNLLDAIAGRVCCVYTFVLSRLFRGGRDAMSIPARSTEPITGVRSTPAAIPKMLGCGVEVHSSINDFGSDTDVRLLILHRLEAEKLARYKLATNESTATQRNHSLISSTPSSSWAGSGNPGPAPRPPRTLQNPSTAISRHSSKNPNPPPTNQSRNNSNHNLHLSPYQKKLPQIPTHPALSPQNPSSEMVAMLISGKHIAPSRNSTPKMVPSSTPPP